MANLLTVHLSADGREIFGFFAKASFGDGLREGADKFLLKVF